MEYKNNTEKTLGAIALICFVLEVAIIGIALITKIIELGLGIDFINHQQLLILAVIGMTISVIAEPNNWKMILGKKEENSVKT